MNSAVPQSVSIRLYNTFSSYWGQSLYFTEDSLSFHSYCIFAVCSRKPTYKAFIRHRSAPSHTDHHRCPIQNNNNPVLVSLFLQLSKTFSKYCMKLLTLHLWKQSNPILDDVTGIWSPVVSIVALRSRASTSAERANVATQEKTETCLPMSAQSLKRLTAQPPAPSRPCVLGTFPCIHLAGEHTQSLFSCSDYLANTYRWWCWSHQCWRWHSDPSWNDASWSWLPSLGSRPVRTHTFCCVSLLVVSYRALFLLRLGASPPGRGGKKRNKDADLGLCLMLEDRHLLLPVPDVELENLF